MKLIKALLGKKDETPKWDIKPPSERPAPRKSKVIEEPAPVAEKKERNPFLDDEALDTLALEVDDINDDNPYATHSWQIDPENDTRKLKTIQIGQATEKNPERQFNPYDTGSMRRGWKK